MSEEHKMANSSDDLSSFTPKTVLDQTVRLNILQTIYLSRLGFLIKIKN